MGRGRVQLRPIENKIRRQVTFSKRRTGLVKKAQEISVLCDAEVGLIVFSTKGKLFEYSAGSSMEKILDRYERCSYAGDEVIPLYSESQGSCSAEYSKLMRMVDVLQRNMRHLKGEQLDALSIRELQSLEQQIDAALKRMRSRKNQLLHESIAQLQKKEKEMKIQNSQLTKKLKENQGMLADGEDLEQQNLSQNLSSTVSQPLPPPPAPPAPHLLSSPPLSLGRVTFPATEAGDGEAQSQTRRTNKMLPHWMPQQEEE